MIVEGMTSNDMVVREGQNVSLMCKARGYPEPYVMWRREDGEEMLIGGEHGKWSSGQRIALSVHELCLLNVTFALSIVLSCNLSNPTETYSQCR